MARKFLAAILTVITAAILSGAIYALGGGTSDADFLKIGVGARSSAMGGAFSAVDDDATAAYWNPAGVASMDKINITAMHILWYANSNYDYIAATAPIDNTTGFGLSVNYFWVPPFNSTRDSSGAALAPDAPLSYDMAVTASIAKIVGNLYTKDFTIGNIALGANLTYIKRSILGVDIDPIFMFDTGLLCNLTDSLKAAFVLQNIGSSSGGDQAPFDAKLGLSYSWLFSKDFNVLFSADAIKPIDITDPDYVKLFADMGVEMKIIDMLYLRGGYQMNDPDESFTVGMGFAFKNLGSIDYAFVPHKELGATHRISVSVSFGNAVERPVIGGPQPPQHVTSIAGDRVVSIGWDPNPEANITGYNIYFRKKGALNFEKLNTRPILEEAKYKTMLQNDTTYEFAVTALNNRDLESIKSDIVQATPKKYVPVKPPVVRGLMTKTDEQGIIVMWEDTGDLAVAGYNLYYRKSTDEKFRKLNKQLLRETKATLAGLTQGVRYNFTVTSVNRDGLESDFSEVVSAALQNGQ
jgi:hypothetical protein